MTELVLPGRLGNPDMTFGEAPRAAARIAAAMAMMDLSWTVPGNTQACSKEQAIGSRQFF